MTPKEFSVLCSLIIVSDPWPLSMEDKVILECFADTEASRLGFDNWIEAYHALPGDNTHE